MFARAWPCLLVTALSCARWHGAAEDTPSPAAVPDADAGREIADANAMQHDAACRTIPGSLCCEPPPAAQSGTLIERLSGDDLYPLRALAFEPNRCGLYVAGFDQGPSGGRIAVSRLSAWTAAPVWSQSFETAGQGSAYGMALAPDGDVVVIGGTAWTGDRQPERAWLHKLSSDGVPVWSEPRTLGPGDYTDSRQVAIRSDGAIAVIGSFNGAVPQSTYVMLFDRGGSPSWPAPFTESESLVEGSAVVFAPDGDLIIGGRRSLQDGGALSVQRIDEAGRPVMLPDDAFAGPGPIFAPAMALGRDESLVVAACHLRDERRQLWLQKFDLSGQALWSEPVVSDWPGHVIVQDVTVSAANEIAVVGTMQAVIPGLRDIWVALYSADGAMLWQEPFLFDGLDQPLAPDDESDDLGWAVSFDQFGNVLVAGWYEGRRAFLGRIAR